MKRRIRLGAIAALGIGACAGTAGAEPCLEVTLTGTQGGPPVFQGQAGSGTLVTFGDSATNCRDVILQFDTGRGTTQNLSRAGMPVGRLNAIFLTHMHSDHVEGLPDMLQLRWHFNSAGPLVDLVCAVDTESHAGHTMSCQQYSQTLGDPLIAAGEMAQRLTEDAGRLPGGPSDLVNLVLFEPLPEAQVVWQSGEVTVSAIVSRHVAGHASFRVDTPAGSVVIGGDAGSNTPEPPRETSTSAEVEALAAGADILVHSVIHPVMGPDGGTGFPPPIYFRQSTATDLGAMAERVGAAHLMFTHLIPPVGAPQQGPYVIPGGGLTEADYEDAGREGGFTGNIVVGRDLSVLRLPFGT